MRISSVATGFMVMSLLVSAPALASPHTPEAIQAISDSFTKNFSEGRAAAGRNDHIAACTAYAMALGDLRTLRWHTEGVITETKVKGGDVTALNEQLVQLDKNIGIVETTTKTACAKAS